MIATIVEKEIAMRLTLRLFVVVLFLTLGSTSSSYAQESTDSPAETEQEAQEPTATLEQGTPVPEDTTEPSALPEIPFEIASHDDDWPLANKDYRNTRAVIGGEITSANVDQLQVAWTFPIPGRANYGAAASAPVIVAGVVYFQDLASNVFAIELQDGNVIWEKRYNSPVIGPNGPGVGYGKVFVNSGVVTFAALDIDTGEEVWAVPTGDRPTGAFQPYVYGGYAYFTTQAGVGGEESGDTYRGYAAGTSGHILALDPSTGETVWDFQTVEEGFWGHPEVNSGGGIWFPPAIDTERGFTFWGTGNPAPFPGTFEFPNGSSRQEENLYTNSLVTLAHDTGELIWYNHVNPNDLFDLDFQISPILASVQIEGQQRDVVIGSGKMGHIIAFDRETGDVIWNTAVGIHQNDNLTEIPPDETVVVYPGVLGGVETPMAYADGIVYAPVLNLPTEYSPTAFGATNGTEAVQNAEEHTNIGQGTSEVVALDASNGQVLWSHEFDTDMYGGATVVNDLLFVATFDGMIYALNRITGETEWSYQAPAGINAWPAVADDTIVWPAGFGGNPVLIALRIPDTSVVAASEATAETPAATGGTQEATAEATQAPEGMQDGTEEAESGTGQASSSEFISVDAQNQTVTLNVIASYDDTNGGLNFNGYANGEATYVVPQGWTVNVNFENKSSLPHSALVVPQDALDQNQLTEPVFEGATTPDPQAGTTQPVQFSFTASEQGTYAMACGVPGHASSGQWIVFEVGGSETEPAFQTSGG